VLLDEAHPADIAAVARHLPLTEQVTLFRLLSQERAGEVINQLDDATLLELVQVLEEGEVSRILDEMPPSTPPTWSRSCPASRQKRSSGSCRRTSPRRSRSASITPSIRRATHVAGFRRRQRPRHRRAGHRARAEVGSDERAFELYVVDDHAHLVGVVPSAGSSLHILARR